MITKGERTELRSIVRQQFKVLRSEIRQRQAELVAEAEQRIVERYRERDERRQQVMWKAHEIAEAASREITDMVRAEGAAHYGHGEVEDVSVESPVRVQVERTAWHDQDRAQRHRAMMAAIEAQIQGALLQLERQEVDLLRTLAVGAIESAEARSFLEGIPAVSALVPAARLAELEAQFDAEDEG